MAGPGCGLIVMGCDRHKPLFRYHPSTFSHAWSNEQQRNGKQLAQLRHVRMLEIVLSPRRERPACGAACFWVGVLRRGRGCAVPVQLERSNRQIRSKVRFLRWADAGCGWRRLSSVRLLTINTCNIAQMLGGKHKDD